MVAIIVLRGSSSIQRAERGCWHAGIKRRNAGSYIGKSLSDDRVIVTLDFVRGLRGEQLNAETVAAIEECRTLREKRASNIEEFFEAMYNAVDSNVT